MELRTHTREYDGKKVEIRTDGGEIFDVTITDEANDWVRLPARTVYALIDTVATVDPDTWAEYFPLGDSGGDELGEQKVAQIRLGLSEAAGHLRQRAGEYLLGGAEMMASAAERLATTLDLRRQELMNVRVFTEREH